MLALQLMSLPIQISLDIADYFQFSCIVQSWLFTEMYLRIGILVIIDLSITVIENSKIPIALVHAAFRILKLELTLSDVECIAVSLIEQGYIRGYLVHGRSLLVLAKSMSFPQPYSVACKLG